VTVSNAGNVPVLRLQRHTHLHRLMGIGMYWFQAPAWNPAASSSLQCRSRRRQPLRGWRMSAAVCDLRFDRFLGEGFATRRYVLYDAFCSNDAEGLQNRPATVSCRTTIFFLLMAVKLELGSAHKVILRRDTHQNLIRRKIKSPRKTRKARTKIVGLST